MLVYSIETYAIIYIGDKAQFLCKTCSVYLVENRIKEAYISASIIISVRLKSGLASSYDGSDGSR